MLPLQKYTAVKREKINRKRKRKKNEKRETELKSRRKDVGPWRGKGEKPRGVHVSRKGLESKTTCRAVLAGGCHAKHRPLEGKKK